LTYKQIALKQGVAFSTVRSHAHAAFGHLGVHNIGMAVALGLREGWWYRDGTPVAPTPPQPKRKALRPKDPYVQTIDLALSSWLDSRFSDQGARDAMHLALRSAMKAKGIELRAWVHVPSEPDLARLLEFVADGTLAPSADVQGPRRPSVPDHERDPDGGVSD
jgi:hypothetical protein